MRLRSAMPVLFALLTFVSCGKDDDNPNPDPDENAHPGGPYFVGVTEGTGGDDTSFVLSYDAGNRVTKVVNTTLKDSVMATYNSAGNPVKVVAKGDGDVVTVDYTYNAANQLTRINSTYESERGIDAAFSDTLEYNNGLITKKTSYTSHPDINNGQPYLTGYYTYEVTAGNITSIRYFNADGSPGTQKTLTYGSDPNVFKGVSLLNINGFTFIDDIANDECWFNKNLLTGLSQGPSGDVPTINTFTYSYNDEKQLAMVVWGQTFEGRPGGNQTWKLFY
ncbi:hypothetical protein F0L74_20160 [Chitinophaga agrisoli]|uniref:YD repeat-containing protein n=1 Tax=Chitinophaga agrisoli TaxID=2607653 RepID=A0A5B2VJ29_9BACT|nr:hypothetical protein [Chitinophaga agrisoli]KAA2238540.1 hypothetical protein F0L74_20160 [Chitinophaga agrisoli]